MDSGSECAVVLTAGYGSRMFPVTSVINKSLMPILNLPLIHYLLADLVSAGVRDIALVVSEGGASSGSDIRRYVEGDERLRESFVARGWAAKRDVIDRARKEFSAARFTFLEQPETGLYGTAVPAKLSEEFVAGRNVFYCSGDDLLITDPRPADLVSLRSSAAGAGGAMQVIEVKAADAHRYGMVETKQQNGQPHLARLVEKGAAPSPSRLANISRYYFTPEIFDHVRTLAPDPGTGELMITDALTLLADSSEIAVSRAQGTYFDCGSVDGWLAANNFMAHREAQGAPKSQ